MKVLIAYYSKTGNTKQMAETIAESIKKENLEVILKRVEEVKAEDLVNYQGLIFGTPTYYGTCAYQIKKLLDESVAFHGKLDGKIGGAFTSSNNIGGGNETAISSILEAMLIHGMIIQGDFQGDHYGPVAIGALDKRAEANCQRFAKRFADLLKKISG
ncbi:MAG: flavodoxin domain-containing protein [Candidatus Omnitrophica bacterium]|nr:flavodoxin domain-containing protein [Candidatus Omnitrophota bacterium]